MKALKNFSSTVRGISNIISGGKTGPSGDCFFLPRLVRILSSSSNQTAIKDFKDDGQGWITSDNIRKVKAGSGSGNNDSFGGLNRMKGSGGFSRHERVACLTNDFSMQNVLIQMNLIRFINFYFIFHILI